MNLCNGLTAKETNLHLPCRQPSPVTPLDNKAAATTTTSSQKNLKLSHPVEPVTANTAQLGLDNNVSNTPLLSSTSNHPHQSLSPNDTTCLASITLFLTQLQPPSPQPCIKDIFHLYLVVLRTLPQAESDLAVRLASAVLDIIKVQSSLTEDGVQSLEQQLQAQQLSALITTGMQHIARSSSLSLLTSLIALDVDAADTGLKQSRLMLSTASGSGSSSSSATKLVSCLLQGCITGAGKVLSEEQLLSVVCSMLYLQVPPSQPRAFMIGLCRAVARYRSVPTHLLLQLPQVAALCGTQLPPDFMPLFQSMLVDRQLVQLQQWRVQRNRLKQQRGQQQEEEVTFGHTSKGHVGASSPSVLLQGIFGSASKIDDSDIAMQLLPMVIQPLLHLHQPVTSTVLLEASADHWLNSLALISRGTSDYVGQGQYPGLLANCASLLHTVSQGPSVTHPSRTNKMSLLATQALKLAVTVTTYNSSSSSLSHVVLRSQLF